MGVWFFCFAFVGGVSWLASGCQSAAALSLLRASCCCAPFPPAMLLARGLPGATLALSAHVQLDALRSAGSRLAHALCVLSPPCFYAAGILSDFFRK